MKHFKYISLFFILLATSIVSAQVKFEAKVNKKKLGINEYLRVDFEININVDSIIPPSFSNFEVIDGPLENVNSSWVGGEERSYKKNFSYIIKPKKLGSLMVDSATLIHEDITYSTDPVIIKVKRKDKLKRIDLNKTSFTKDIYLKCQYSSDNIQLKDSLEITYKLFVSEEVGVQSWKSILEPKFKNFIVRDITPKRLELDEEQIDEVKYRFVVLKKVILKPTKKGKLKIPPYQIEALIEIPIVEVEDLFEKKSFEDRKTIISTEELIIDVN